MTSEKDPHPIDRHVGARVRLRRTLIGLSQEQLGTQLGLTFQQIQKYEKGTNRISASRLWEIARILDVSVDYFFEGVVLPDRQDPGKARREQLTSVAESTDSLMLLRHFAHISDPRVRRSIVELARALGSSDDKAPDGGASDSEALAACPVVC